MPANSIFSPGTHKCGPWQKWRFQGRRNPPVNPSSYHKWGCGGFTRCSSLACFVSLSSGHLAASAAKNPLDKKNTLRTAHILSDAHGTARRLCDAQDSRLAVQESGRIGQRHCRRVKEDNNPLLLCVYSWIYCWLPGENCQHKPCLNSIPLLQACPTVHMRSFPVGNTVSVGG